MADISFIDCIEQFHIVKGKGNTLDHWVLNAFAERKGLIITGRQLPNLAKELDPDDLLFYYKSMLILFKPHKSVDGLLFQPGRSPPFNLLYVNLISLLSDQSYKDAYFQFLDTALSSLAEAAKLHEDFNQNHYESNEKDYQQEETDEERILREHPLLDSFAENVPFPDIDMDEGQDPTSLQNFEEELAAAFARSVLEDADKIDPYLDEALSLSVHSTPPPPVATLPTYTSVQSYMSAISIPPSSPDVFINGASSYQYLVSQSESSMDSTITFWTPNSKVKPPKVCKDWSNIRELSAGFLAALYI
ncbi:hypothetical protein BJ741DRAFT_585132 [Chytriomyces cf. hyalinus JEL632]|nr:hypothetical protein BJ741DRAFT_585132 [Chytriomyces cf. hyalinus JEL632]